jgi:hypothetical protein
METSPAVFESKAPEIQGIPRAGCTAFNREYDEGKKIFGEPWTAKILVPLRDEG